MGLTWREQGLVTGDDLLLEGLAATFRGRAFHHEPTLRPDGDYHGVREWEEGLQGMVL